MTRVGIFHILWGSKNNVKMRICTEYSSRLVFYYSESFVYKFARIYWQNPVSSSKGDNVWRGEGRKCTRYHGIIQFQRRKGSWSKSSPTFQLKPHRNLYGRAPYKAFLQSVHVVCVAVQSPSHVPFFATPWTVARQSPSPSPSSRVCPSSCPLHQWCHPAISSSSTLSLSQNQGLFQWVSSLHQMTKILELQLQHQSFQWVFTVDFL